MGQHLAQVAHSVAIPSCLPTCPPSASEHSIILQHEVGLGSLPSGTPAVYSSVVRSWSGFYDCHKAVSTGGITVLPTDWSKTENMNCLMVPDDFQYLRRVTFQRENSTCSPFPVIAILLEKKSFHVNQQQLSKQTVNGMFVKFHHYIITLQSLAAEHLGEGGCSNIPA